jgi:hypothetical protein
MTTLKRTNQLLIFLSAWFFVTAIVSLIIIRILYLSELPASLNHVSADIKNIQDLVTIKKVCVIALDYAYSQKDFNWLLINWALSFVALWAVTFGTVLVYFQKKLHQYNAVEHSLQSESIIDLAIAGKLPLWKAFWGVFIGLSYGLSFAIYAFLSSLNRLHIIESAKVSDLIITPLAYSLILVTYLFTADIAWRCSRNSANNFWHYLTRAVILLLIVVPLIKIMLILYHFHIIPF